MTNIPTRPNQDIWAVRKTWVGALSLFSRRRVLRGAGAYRQPGEMNKCMHECMGRKGRRGCD